MDHHSNFEKWLSNKFGEKNGTKTSYLRALDLLSNKLSYNILQINEPDEIKALYEDVKKEQRIGNGKYMVSEASSYGTKGFYSAALKNYLTFLEEHKKNG